MEYIDYPEEYNYFFPSGRQQLIKYIIEKYGQDSISQIVTYGTLATRLILKDAARILNIDHNEINEINKFVPSDAGFQWKISECLFGSEDGEKQPVPEIVQYYNNHQELFETALELEGNPRHTSIHAAGVVLAPGNIQKYIPLMVGDQDEIVSQWDMKNLEAIGMLKIDLLGLRMLGTVQRTNEFIKGRYGIDIDYYNIPREDPEALDIIKQGKTKGIFQCESDGMSSIFKRLKTVSFEDIVAVLALYRPGPMAYLDSYIKRANGTEKVSYLFPELEPILKDTYGILLYQEQVMKIATDCAGFTKAQSDTYRKVIGKKQVDKIPIYNDWLVNGNKEMNITGLVANGVDRELAEKLAQDLVSFAKYCFNRAHAVAYAIQTVTTAWYKAHYPLEYMTALLSSYINKNKDKIVLYIQDCKDMGITVLPPDVNFSNYEFAVEDDSIRFGFGAIKGLGFVSIEIMLERQRNGHYKSLQDFIERNSETKLNKRSYDALIFSGALDNFSSMKDELTKREDIFYKVYELNSFGTTHKTLEKFEENKIFTIKNIVSEETKRDMIYKSIEKEVNGVQFTKHILTDKAQSVNWHDEKFETVGIIKKILQKISKADNPYLIIEIDTLEGNKTLFLFENLEKLSQKLKVNGIRLFSIQNKLNAKGNLYILKDCKYYREEKE